MARGERAVGSPLRRGTFEWWQYRRRCRCFRVECDHSPVGTLREGG